MSTRTTVTPEQAVATVRDVLAAGRLLHRAQKAVTWRLKPDGSFVTDLDRLVEDRLRARLEARFPGWAFVGEEGAPDGSAAAAGRCRIVLDPIDGTAAFARGLNFYAISLGLFDAGGRPALAVLHLPSMDRCFVATSGPGGGRLRRVERHGGAIRLRPVKPPRPPRRSDLANAYVYLGSDPHLTLDLSGWKGKVRALGATASHLGLLLEGTIDPIAAVVTRYKIWDVAAGLALAEAAGLEVLDVRDRRRVGITELLDETDLPPLLVAPRGLAAYLAHRVRVSRPRGRSAGRRLRGRDRKRPSRG